MKLKDPSEILRETYTEIRERNPAFSLRAFAKKLDIAAPILSEIINGKRKVSSKYVDGICSGLKLSPEEKEIFVKAILKEKTKLRDLAKRKSNSKNEQMVSEEASYNILADWEYYALYTLVELPEFQDDIYWMAKKLNLTEERVKFVYNELVKEGFLIKKNDILVKEHPKLTSTNNVVSRALREGHRQSLELAIQKLDVPRDLRFYSSSTIAIDREKMTEARSLIREFRGKLSDLLSEGNKSDVYLFGVQLLPLTTVGES